MAQNKVLNLLLNLVRLIWIAPLFLSFIVAASVVMYGGINAGNVVGMMMFASALVPIAYLIAFLISNVREDRLFFFGVLTGYAVCTALSIGVSLLDPNSGTVIAWIWLVYAIAALTLAFLRIQLYLERIEQKKGGRLRESTAPQRTSGSLRRKLDRDAHDAPHDTAHDDTAAAAASVAAAISAITAQAPDTAQTPTAPDAAPGASQALQPVDVNSCQMTDLLVLPGMTIGVARQIVSEREAHGPYESVQQLVARNDLKPHAIVNFVSYLNIAPIAEQSDSGHRTRMLDL